ncbi:hypothetical protein RI129_010495 [Pyrocoelia pectoralis]|uniref:THAP-type domain-containing protein n=1 Tax=Pyrocoelia pectoralis TaxID=417401 RepID=A0AAN7ZJZ9_9COLE
MTSYTGVSAKLVFTNDCLAIMEPSKRCYKWCFVPMCTNTTFTSPEKTFLTMPRDVKIRKMWFKAARRDYSKITSSDFYCCEDHFDVRFVLKPFGNYLQYLLLCRNVQVTLLSTIPHTVLCQSARQIHKRTIETYLKNLISSTRSIAWIAIRATSAKQNNFFKHESTNTKTTLKNIYQTQLTQTPHSQNTLTTTSTISTSITPKFCITKPHLETD